MALFDTHKAEQDFTPGVYVTDGQMLWRILDIAEKRKGEVPLEDCLFPDSPPHWRKVDWLMAQKARVIRPVVDRPDMPEL